MRNKFPIKHGRIGTPEYRAWANMKSRCYRPSYRNFSDYGGRGIGVCDSWRDSFENFFSDMGQRPSPRHSLDRYPDKNGNYEPGNCRWATWHQQATNTRRNRDFTFNDETLTVGAWAVRYGVDRGVLRHRLQSGWDFESAVTTPTENQTGRLYTYSGKAQSISAWAKEYGLSRAVLKHRLQRSKWPIEKALTMPITPRSGCNQVSRNIKPDWTQRWSQ